ncbi:MULTISPECIES: ABC transporter permease [Cellulosimicrobium]|uniref:Transport permease protein n=1 Tax=Cellulosimicrobium sp. ES-005 TaxID=3163031 RepID=A0AAU8FWY6_9MICO|nr:ABC transporter permease [Cellulosimicrobium cellulans]MCO7275339.1 ABC transporter permease [Cellulosimicrobium cellulans]
MTAVVHTGLLTARALRQGARIPVFMVMNLVQPMIWLLLFGQLFQAVVEIPGFSTGGTYLEFITPGVVMMTAMFGAAWAGTSYVQDMDRGVMDRFLTSPASRGALMASTMIYQAVIAVGQALVVLAVAWLCGARFGSTPGETTLGVLALLLAVVLLTALFSALSNAMALLTGQQEALIGISQLITLPLMFLSSAVMDTRLSADWVADVARYNPFDWAVVAGREALAASPDWGVVWGRLGLLALAAVVMGWLATQAFRTRQRSA